MSTTPCSPRRFAAGGYQSRFFGIWDLGIFNRPVTVPVFGCEDSSSGTNVRADITRTAAS
jgi:hypothetical protein